MTPFLVAATRAVPRTINACELTHLARQPIDLDRAVAQHRAYEAALQGAGCRVVPVEAAPELPDSVFVEDTAVVFDEVALIARPGAASRRAEGSAVERLLGAYRPLERIVAPGTLDGGDVLVVGRTVYVGISRRTNAAAVEQLRGIMAPRGYVVREVTVSGCLHLKSAATALPDGRILVNRRWIDADRLDDRTAVDIDPAEPGAANALSVAGAVIYPVAFPRTRQRLERLGYRVRSVDVAELAKAEGAVTCCSLIFTT